MTGLGAPCTLGPPTLTPVDRNKACCFWSDKFIVVDKSTRNNVCYGRSVLPLQVRVGLRNVESVIDRYSVLSERCRSTC